MSSKHDEVDWKAVWDAVDAHLDSVAGFGALKGEVMANDGGPAFPRRACVVESIVDWGTAGMSLRDWFAGQALVGLVANTEACYSVLDKVAIYAYRCADAMLKARE